MKSLCRLTMGLLLGLAAWLSAQPPAHGRSLTPEEQKEVARLTGEVGSHALAGRFEDAVAVAKRVVEYRQARQGANHWQVLDARLLVEQWQRLALVPARNRTTVGRALFASGEGRLLQQQLRFRQAEVKFRLSLAFLLLTLGEDHPQTSSGYYAVAQCLDLQGRHREALPLHRKALAIDLKALGEQHSLTATAYMNVAHCLQSQGKDAEALPLFRKALAIYQKVLGEEYPHTGIAYNNVASCLDSQGKYAEALLLYRKSLALSRRLLGEQSRQTAGGYNNVAGCLQKQGKYAEALPLLRKALTIFRAVLGEDHPDTANGYHSVGTCLNSLRKYAEAVPLFRKALAIHRKVHGEQHPDTAKSYSGMAFSLSSQGQHAEALSLYRKALAICRRVLGEEHPDTASNYGGVGLCLNSQGKHAEALPLFEKALAIRLKVAGERDLSTANGFNGVASCLVNLGRKEEALRLLRKALAIQVALLGEQDIETARGYNNLAACLNGQGKHAEALPLFRKSLAIDRKVLGEEHPRAATSYNNVAMCLVRQGKLTEALPLFEKALAIERKALGEQHPDTAQSYNHIACCLNDERKYAEAARTWEKALPGSEWGRLQASASGFDRSLYKVGIVAPRAALVACLVRLGKPLEAWQHAEADLARGLLDDLLAAPEDSRDADPRARLLQLDQDLLPLLALEKPDSAQVKRREALRKERDGLLATLASRAALRLRERILPLPRIQKQLPADAALVFWLDVRDEHLGCVLRREGPPAWVRLPGTGKSGWASEDGHLPGLVLTALADGRGDTAARQRLLVRLHRQRLAPLEPHLKGVRRLLVVPAGAMAAVPVEALTDRYTVSYVPSASVFARRAEHHRPLQASSLLVLADPTFTHSAPAQPAGPAHGLLVLAVTPGGLAARIGLRPGDILLEYNGKELSSPTDLLPPRDEGRVSVKLWREGKTLAGRIPVGKLGVAIDKRPVAEALAAWRKRESELLDLGRGSWQPLTGTRLEARALTALVPRTSVLLGSDASQQKLAELAAADKLREYRLLHLATHGQANADQPKLTALILAQDRIDDAAAVARVAAEGKKPVEGRLTVGTVLADWRLDADLVVLSACQTGLGADTRGGEGMLGFTQALLQKGARSVVLSRWKVDDAATALLMTRFYENLLGKRKGTKPLGRAEALAEAKAWLRGLSRSEATKRLAALVGGVPRSERGSIKAALPTRKPDAPKGEDRPFAAPYYWAAFVLIGDPD